MFVVGSPVGSLLGWCYFKGLRAMRFFNWPIVLKRCLPQYVAHRFKAQGRAYILNTEGPSSGNVLLLESLFASLTALLTSPCRSAARASARLDPEERIRQRFLLLVPFDVFDARIIHAAATASEIKNVRSSKYAALIHFNHYQHVRAELVGNRIPL